MAEKKRLSRRVVSRYSLQNQKRKKMRILEESIIPVVVESVLLLQEGEFLLQDDSKLLLN